jgi:hypothetical protein
MGKHNTSAVLAAAFLAGCAHAPTGKGTNNHFLRVVSLPKILLKSDPLERIESVDVTMHCGRFVAINHIPDDWSVQISSPVSEETTLRMETGHGSSSLDRSSTLDGFVTVLVSEPACFEIDATLSVFSYDTELHERKVVLKQTDLLLLPLVIDNEENKTASGGRAFTR